MPSDVVALTTREPRKRKTRADESPDTTTNASFQAILVDNSSDTSSSSSATVPFFFVPVATILRAHVPFAWLTTSSTTGPHAGSILKATITSVPSWEYRTLVARRIPNGGLHLFEKLEQDHYISWPLQAFVTEQWVAGAAIGAAPQADTHILQTCSDDKQLEQPQPQPHRRTPSLTTELPKVPKNRKGAAARLSILSATELEPPSATSQPELTPSSTAVVANHNAQPDSAVSQLDDQATLVLHEQDLLAPSYLRQRYLDTLYVSKTSLAYYAKGPLSRARARARAPNSSMDLAQLACFFRDSILPAKKMDTKYKETIPALLERIRTSSELPDDPAKNTKRKKFKLGKNCLWPQEEEFIRKWWLSYTAAPATSVADGASVVRDAIFDLRMRETEMRVILMLEALAIEAKDSTTAKTVSATTSIVKVESVETDQSAVLAPSRTKPVRNLERDIEMEVDNLCIWHSIGLEIPTTNLSASTSKNSTDDAQLRDRPKNFCSDVIIPFYGAKLPEICKKICRTLAGSDLLFEPQKMTRYKIETAKPLPPGTVIKRAIPVAGDRILQRVLSEDLRQPSPPVPTVSATTLSDPYAKREASELSQRPISRGAIRKSVSFTNREIDLVTDARSTAAKKRKLDMVAEHKRELDAAIQALKKPNRTQAGRLYMDEVEGRNSTSLHSLSPPPVHIIATPRPERHRAINTASSSTLVGPGIPAHYATVTVPSSTKKTTALHNGISERKPSSDQRAVLSAVFDTPSRKASKHVNALGTTPAAQGGTYSFSPNISKADSIAAHVLATPSKRPVHAMRDQENGIPEAASKIMDRAMGNAEVESSLSIYDSLGWNDDYEI